MRNIVPVPEFANSFKIVTNISWMKFFEIVKVTHCRILKARKFSLFRIFRKPRNLTWWGWTWLVFSAICYKHIKRSPRGSKSISYKSYPHVLCLILQGLKKTNTPLHWFSEKNGKISFSQKSLSFIKNPKYFTKGHRIEIIFHTFFWKN